MKYVNTHAPGSYAWWLREAHYCYEDRNARAELGAFRCALEVAATPLEVAVAEERIAVLNGFLSDAAGRVGVEQP